MTSRLANYDLTVAGSVGQALWALLAEYDLDGVPAELVLRDLRVDAATLFAIVDRARTLGLAVVDVRHHAELARHAQGAHHAQVTHHVEVRPDGGTGPGPITWPG